MKKRRDRKSQVWVETVVYTLIGLTIIGIVVGMALPKIKKSTDKAIIEQTISALNELDEKITETQSASGNSRIINFRIKKGNLLIDSKRDILVFEIEDSLLMYSQPGSVIPQGNIFVLTEGELEDKEFNINLILNYSSSLNLTYDGDDIEYTLTQAPTAYQILMKNQGSGNLDFSLV